MAGSLVILMPCALGLLVYGWGHMPWRSLVLIGLGLLIVAAVLLLTQSRGGLLSLSVTLVLMLLMRWKKGWLLLACLLLPGLVLAAMLGPQTMLQVLATGHTLDTLDTRLEVWSRALYLIRDFPLTGSGMGSFQAVTQLLYPFFTTSRAIPHAHNLFLQVAVDLGLPGLVAWLGIWLIATLASWQVYRYGCSLGHWEVSGLGAGLFCSQLALAAHGLVDAVTWGAVRPAVIPWALWACSMASWQVCKTGLWAIDRPGQMPACDSSGSSLPTETLA
jgi:putative inorganic carbon (HCO3(-)) transporter